MLKVQEMQEMQETAVDAENATIRKARTPRTNIEEHSGNKKHKEPIKCGNGKTQAVRAGKY